MNSLNAFDWLLIGILAYSTITALLRGFFRSVFSLVGIVAGILLASWNYDTFAATLTRWFSSLATARVAAFLLIAIGVMVICGLLGRLLHSTARAVGLGFLDRLFGGLFGLARGCLLGVAILMAVAAFSPQTTWIAQSRLSSYFLAGAHAVSFVVPQDLRQQIFNGAEQLKHTAPEWIKPDSQRHKRDAAARTAREDSH